MSDKKIDYVAGRNGENVRDGIRGAEAMTDKLSAEELVSYKAHVTRIPWRFYFDEKDSFGSYELERLLSHIATLRSALAKIHRKLAREQARKNSYKSALATSEAALREIEDLEAPNPASWMMRASRITGAYFAHAEENQ